MKFGILLDYQYEREDTFGPRLDEVIALTETARDLGFDSVFGFHHYLASAATPQPFAVLGRLIPHSGTMQLGTSVYLATVEHPIRLAENAATLDQLSGGRLVLGLGAGYRRDEFDAFGVERSTRWGRLRETVELIDQLFTGETVKYHGEHFAVTDQTISLVPRQRPRPPIWVGANGPRTVLRAARIGDTWIAPPNVKANWAKGNLAAFREEQQRAGATPATERPILRELYVADSAAQADAEAGQFIRHEYATLSRYDLGHFQSMFEDLRRKAFLFGSPDDTAAGIADLASAGFNHFIFRVCWGRMPLEMTLRSVRRFAAEVMPRFSVSGGHRIGVAS